MSNLGRRHRTSVKDRRLRLLTITPYPLACMVSCIDVKALAKLQTNICGFGEIGEEMLVATTKFPLVGKPPSATIAVEFATVEVPSAFQRKVVTVAATLPAG
jgi:hypothetical protein